MLKQHVAVPLSVQVPIATSSVEPTCADPLKNRTLLCKHKRVEALIKTCPLLLEDRGICLWLLKQGIL